MKLKVTVNQTEYEIEVEVEEEERQGLGPIIIGGTGSHSVPTTASVSAVSSNAVVAPSRVPLRASTWRKGTRSRPDRYCSCSKP